MTFNDTTNKTGIIQNIERYINMGDAWISGTAARLADFTNYCNEVGKDVWHLIFTANGNWKYDDSNQTDLPQAVCNLVSGTSKYALPTTALTVQRIELKDANGDWYLIEPITQNTIPGAIDEYYETDAQPMRYRLVGSTIELFPGPNYASTGGLKVYFDRTSVAFATSDTTATPGFAEPYHEIIPIGAAIKWLSIKLPTSNLLPILMQKYAKKEQELIKFYQVRFKDYRPQLTRLTESFK